jgi:magnesium-transporting ATPase (P-type)
MSFNDQDLIDLVFYVVLYGAAFLFLVFILFRRTTSGNARLEGELHRRSERPADYWIDVAYIASMLCWLCWMAFTHAVRGRPDFSSLPLLVIMTSVAMMVARALVARFVNDDNRHFRRTWWAARYWSWLLLGTAFAAFFLLVPKA